MADTYKLPSAALVRQKILADSDIQTLYKSKQKPVGPLKDLHASTQDDSIFDLDISRSVEGLLSDFGLFNDSTIDQSQLSNKETLTRFHSDADSDSLVTSKQMEILLSFIPPHRIPKGLAASSQHHNIGSLLDTLSRLALQPALAIYVYARFRPLWVDIVSRWLTLVHFNGVDFGAGPHNDGQILEILSAFARIIEWNDVVLP